MRPEPRGPLDFQTGGWGEAGWEGWRAHPHSQRKDAASAEPRCEQGPVGTARYGDVALLVVTYGKGEGVSAHEEAVARGQSAQRRQAGEGCGKS